MVSLCFLNSFSNVCAISATSLGRISSHSLNVGDNPPEPPPKSMLKAGVEGPPVVHNFIFRWSWGPPRATTLTWGGAGGFSQGSRRTRRQRHAKSGRTPQAAFPQYIATLSSPGCSLPPQGMHNFCFLLPIVVRRTTTTLGVVGIKNSGEIKKGERIF